MPDYGLDAESLLLALPLVLSRDDSARALAEAAARALADRREELDAVRIYPNLEEMPEELLDILAYDFKVDWWDPGYTPEEKLDTLVNSWRVHRYLGTKYAVETAISSIYAETTVQEWFEYGGEPYHFKILVDARYEDADPVKHARVLERVNAYKNLRSVLDEVEYYDAGGTASAYMTAAIAGTEITDSAAAVRY